MPIKWTVISFRLLITPQHPLTISVQAPINPTQLPFRRGTIMNKSDLIEALRKKTGLSATKAEQVIEVFFDQMSNPLATGDRVHIRGSCSIFVSAFGQRKALMFPC